VLVLVIVIENLLVLVDKGSVRFSSRLTETRDGKESKISRSCSVLGKTWVVVRFVLAGFWFSFIHSFIRVKHG